MGYIIIIYIYLSKIVSTCLFGRMIPADEHMINSGGEKPPASCSWSKQVPCSCCSISAQWRARCHQNRQNELHDLKQWIHEWYPRGNSQVIWPEACGSLVDDVWLFGYEQYPFWCSTLLSWSLMSCWSSLFMYPHVYLYIYNVNYKFTYMHIYIYICICLVNPPF